MDEGGVLAEYLLNNATLSNNKAPTRTQNKQF